MVNGQRPSTNCTITAWAQLMAFHRYPARGTGQSTLLRPQNITIQQVNLNTVIDWNSMLDSYRRDGADSTQQQRNAVASLMFNIAAAYGISGSGPAAMVNNFGYDRSIQRHYRIYYNDAEWEALIRSQLDSGLPVYYSAARDGGGHAFIVDGYDNTGRFHVNWGWSGSRDGWYSLNALTPGSRNYNRNHSIIINIKPDQGSTGSNEMALLNFTSDKTSVKQNELFTLSIRIRSSGFFTGGQAAAVLLDNNGNISAVLRTINYNSLNISSTRTTSSMQCYVSDSISPGAYRLGIAVRTTGGDWKTVKLSSIAEGIPSFLNFTVRAGEARGDGYGIAVVEFSPDKTTVTGNESFGIRLRTKNIGSDTFPGGELGIALVDSNGNIAGFVREREYASINPGTTRTSTVINCRVPNSVRPGQYSLRIMIRPDGNDEWRTAAVSIDDCPTSISFTVR